MKNNVFVEKIAKIAEELEIQKGFVNDEYWLEFKRRYNSIKNEADNIMKDGRVLRIGIVGEVKAGKSSFLNALIFDGEDILPKASTPMTAALTTIAYSKQPKAKIIFYKDYDWKEIEELSFQYDMKFQELLKEYSKKLKARAGNNNQNSLRNKVNEGINSIKDLLNKKSVVDNISRQISPQFKACKELTEMVKKNGVNVADYIGREVEIRDSDIKTRLSEYIGAEGKFTPIVKNVELYLDNPLLEGFEIIDTPGLNDPILSRSDKTKKFLIKCDVVFLLCYCGQFLTSEEIRLINNTFPSEGINKVILIGSKFDSGVLDYKKRSCSLKEAVIMSRRNFEKQATEEIEKCSHNTVNLQVIESIQKSLPPVFVSSLMYGIAKKVENNDNTFNEFEKNIVNNYEERFEGFELNKELLYELSNIEKIRNQILEEIRNDKDKTIEEKNRSFLESQKATLLSILENINIEAKHNLFDLKNYDAEKLEERLNNLKTKLNSIRLEVKNTFESAAIDAKGLLNRISINIKEEINNYLDVKITTETSESTSTYNTGFLGLRKERVTTTTVENVASVEDVIGNIRKYIVKCEKLINSEFDKIINIFELKKNVKEIIIGAFDLADNEFDEKCILMPLDNTLKKLTMPSIDIDQEEFDNMILPKFASGYAKGNDIHNLMIKEEKTLREVSNKIRDILKCISIEMETILLTNASTFVDNIEKELSENVKLLESKLSNKEEHIKEYEKFIDNIAKLKEDLISIEK